jgi:hypothetical protein
LIPIAAGGAARFGLLRPGEEGHRDLAAILERVEGEGFARLVGAPASGEG